MQNPKNLIENSQIEDWINSDLKLKNLLNDIDLEVESESDQAKLGFYRIAKEYELPKFPGEAEDSNFPELSIFETLGRLKFVQKDFSEIKVLVVFAAYLVKNNLEPDIEEELIEFLGNDNLSGIGYKGEDIDVELIPIKSGESWSEKGCTYFTKEIDID